MKQSPSNKITQSISQSPVKPAKIKLYTIDQVTHPKKKLFIETFYATNGNVTATTKAVKVHRRSFYNWLDTDPCFKAIIDEQKLQLMDEIDEVCRNTAKTKQGITDRIFWLKTHHPDYQQRDTMAFKDSNGNQFVLTRGR